MQKESRPIPKGRAAKGGKKKGKKKYMLPRVSKKNAYPQKKGKAEIPANFAK